MRFEYPKEKYLFDGGGDTIVSTSMNTVHGTLKAKGYYYLDTSYDKKAYIAENELLNDFEPLKNTATILYSAKGEFSSYFCYWKHKTLDVYISVDKQEYDDSLEDDVDINGSFYDRLFKENPRVLTVG